VPLGPWGLSKGSHKASLAHNQENVGLHLAPDKEWHREQQGERVGPIIITSSSSTEAL
jgi:hypothetical protein